MLSLPQLGNMIAVAAALPDILQLLQKWRKQHGDIFTIRMGSKYMVVICSYKVHDYVPLIQQNAGSCSDRIRYTTYTCTTE